jgi:hypothetical protein
MFRSEKSAKYALIALMGFFGIPLPLLYLREMYELACLCLGLELVFCWAYLNPWILLRKYSLYFPVDTSRMEHNAFLIVGAIVVVGACAMIFLD